jgi:hypothetical protein
VLEDSTVDPGEQIAVALWPWLAITRANVNHQLTVESSSRTGHVEPRPAQLFGKRLEKRQLGADLFDSSVAGAMDAQSKVATVRYNLEHRVVDQANRTNFESRWQIVSGDRRACDP